MTFIARFLTSVEMLVFFVISLSCAIAQTPTPTHVIDIKSAGAVGDGKADDTLAIQKAIDQAAGSSTGGEVDFSAGTYLTGSLELKSHVTLHLEKGAVIQGSDLPGAYPIVTARWEGIERPCHRALISAKDATAIAVTGEGSVIGSPTAGRLRDPRGPTLIETISCKEVRIEGITVSSVQMWTLHPTYCQNVTISHVTIDSKDFNSDGIDPDSCHTVLIDGCTFTSGDDDIAIKSGKGQEGVKRAMPCEDITISNCTFLKGYSSIALGSELSGGIRHVVVSNCTFQHGRAALYLKSRPGRAGVVDDVQASNLKVEGEPLLEIQTTYSFNPDGQSVPGPEGLTRFSNIVVTDAVLTNCKAVANVDAKEDKPVDGVTLRNISGTAKEGIVLRNAANVKIENVTVSVKGPLLKTLNVQGTGLDGAVPIGK